MTLASRPASPRETTTVETDRPRVGMRTRCVCIRKHHPLLSYACRRADHPALAALVQCTRSDHRGASDFRRRPCACGETRAEETLVTTRADDFSATSIRTDAVTSSPAGAWRAVPRACPASRAGFGACPIPSCLAQERSSPWHVNRGSKSPTAQGCIPFR